MPIAWRHRDERYVEKLATPDVTIADIIGDIDPIKAARGGLQLSDELTMHFGLLPRANRCIFAINELPDLAGKIQVGLFNILQEGDVQIKGYPVRLPLDVLMVLQREPRGLHGARQDHHAAQGPHRLGDPDALPGQPRRSRMAITAQEAWTARDREPTSSAGRRTLRRPRLHPRDRRGGRVPGPRRLEGRQALGRQPAPADQRARERRLQRRAARARRRRGRRGAARHRHLRGAAGHHRASSSWSTRANCAAPTTSPTT